MKVIAWIGLFFCFLSCKSDEQGSEPIQKILVIGNSITYHPPDAAIGWNADWGMAASAPDKDYFSLLEDSLRYHLPELEMMRENVYPFERKFSSLDFAMYEHLRDFQADMLVIRLGENIPLENLEGWNFSQSLREFAAFLSSGQTRVLLTTTFWPNTAVNDQLLHAAAEMNWQVVQLSQLGAQDSYMAMEEYSNESVARHPNDQGMQAISRLIAGKILGE